MERAVSTSQTRARHRQVEDNSQTPAGTQSPSEGSRSNRRLYRGPLSLASAAVPVNPSVPSTSTAFPRGTRRPIRTAANSTANPTSTALVVRQPSLQSQRVYNGAPNAHRRRAASVTPNRTRNAAAQARGRLAAIRSRAAELSAGEGPNNRFHPHVPFTTSMPMTPGGERGAAVGRLRRARPTDPNCTTVRMAEITNASRRPMRSPASTRPGTSPLPPPHLLLDSCELQRESLPLRSTANPTPTAPNPRLPCLPAPLPSSTVTPLSSPNPIQATATSKFYPVLDSLVEPDVKQQDTSLFPMAPHHSIQRIRYYIPCTEAETTALAQMDGPPRNGKKRTDPPHPPSVPFVVQGIGQEPRSTEPAVFQGRRMCTPPYATYSPYVIQGKPPVPRPDPPTRRMKKAVPRPPSLASYVIHGGIPPPLCASGANKVSGPRRGKRMTPPPYPTMAPYVIQGPPPPVTHTRLTCLWNRNLEDGNTIPRDRSRAPLREPPTASIEVQTRTCAPTSSGETRNAVGGARPKEKRPRRIGLQKDRDSSRDADDEEKYDENDRHFRNRRKTRKTRVCR